MKIETRAITYVCDGCGKTNAQIGDDDLPSGIYLQVTEVVASWVDVQEIHACSRRCLNTAMRKHQEGWEDGVLHR